jgi:glucose/arabinose dehydrogenase
MKLDRMALLAVLLAAASACEKKSPPTPSPGPNGAETIRGTERLGWDQRAADTAELAVFRYAVYVDGARSEVTEVSCGSTSGTNGFSCSGRLPSLTPGQHTLELAAFTLDGGTTLESSRSAPLSVNVTSALAGLRAGSLRAGTAGTTGDGISLRLDVVLDQLDEPSDIAFAPDGRLFLAERGGLVRVIDLRRGTQSTSEIDGEIVTLALDRDFERTRYVFAAAVASDPVDGGAAREAFAVVRYREVNGRLGERMVLLHGIPARADRAAAALGIASDGTLHVALDDGGDTRTVDDAASLNGKLLRLNRDGTTPDDRPVRTPVQQRGYRSPRALDWGPGGVLWIAEGAPRSPERLNFSWSGEIPPSDPTVPLRSARGARIDASDHPPVAIGSGAYALPPNTDPSDMVVYRGDLFASFRGNLIVAAEGGRHLLRVRLDPRSPTRVIATERLLEGVGPIRAVAVGPDGAIYVATQSALGRLSVATVNP